MVQFIAECFVAEEGRRSLVEKNGMNKSLLEIGA